MSNLRATTTRTTSITPTQQRFFQSVRVLWIVWAALIAVVTFAAVPFYQGGADTRFCAPIRDALIAAQIPSDACAGYVTILGVIVIVIGLGISAIIYLRQSTQWAGVIASFVPAAFCFMSFNFAFDLASAQPELTLWLYALQTFNYAMVVLGLFTLPDGKFVPRFSKWLLLAFLVMNTAIHYGNYLAALNTANTLVTISNWLQLGLGVAMQVYRYFRVATPQQRQQAKLLVGGTVATYALTLTTVIITGVIAGALRNTPNNGLLLLIHIVIVTVRLLMFAIVPVAFAVSILRFRLWDVDLFINRTLAAAVISAVLGVVFLSLLLLVQQITLMLTNGEQSAVAVAAASLGVALLFNPTRMRVQRFIDRRFYPKHLAQIEAIARAAAPKITTSEHKTLLLEKAELLQTPTAQLVGSYRLIEPLGAGGMAEVYRAEHVHTHEEVAIKTLAKHRVSDQVHLARFEREIEIVGKLNHPNVIKLREAGVMGDTRFMAMEYIEGPSLHRLLQDVGRLRLAEALPIFSEIASAMDYAHSQNLIHRDVNPTNILLDPKPLRKDAKFRVVLADFGIAKMLEAPSFTQGDGVIGTLDYIAPEQIVAARNIDHRADIYAFGVLIYLTLTGQKPFRSTNAGALLMAHLQTPPLDPRNFAPDLNAFTAAGILRALDKEPLARPRSASALVRLLNM